MASRAGKKANEPTLSILESLILAQAVYEVGASPATWPHIAALLSKHPLLHRPKSFFTSQSCHLMYDNLLNAAGLPITDKNASPHAPVNTQLAQKFYNLRYNELVDRIMQEEANFKSVVTEMEDIRSGAQDNRLKAKITSQPEVSEATDNLEPQAKQDVVQETSSRDKQTALEEEVFDGSDLSGVSDSTSSSSRLDESEKHLPEVSSPNKEVASPPPTPSPNAAELVTNVSGSNEMDVADDDRAEENELADQLVPDHISPNISSPVEDELADVDTVEQLPDMPETDSLHVADSPSATTGEKCSLPLEDGASIVEPEVASQQLIVDSVGESHSTKETDDVSEVEGQSGIHLTEPLVEGSPFVHSDSTHVEADELTPEDGHIQPEQDPKGTGERAQETEERNESPEQGVNTGLGDIAQGTAEVSNRTEALHGAGGPAEQLPEAQTEELMESPSDKMEVEDEDIEIPKVDDPADMQRERDNPSSPEACEDDEVASRSENMPEPVDNGSSSTPAHSLTLSLRNSPTEKESMPDIRSHSADLEEDKDDRLEPATPLDALPTEGGLPSEGKSVIKDEHSSDEGHSLGPRRSTRRRKSSATSTHPSVPTRGRPRRQSQLVLEPEASPAVELEPELDSGVDDSRPSSAPRDIAVSKHQGKRKASVIDGLDIARERKRARDESEPVEEEEIGSGPSAPRGRPPRQVARTDEQKRFQNVIGMLHSQISQHRNGNIFHNPIKNTEAPDYHDIVKRPMDLKTIKAKVKDGLISNSLEYQRDIYLMFANAMMYNRPESDVHSMAEDMMLESEGYIRTFRQTEGLVRGNRG